MKLEEFLAKAAGYPCFGDDLLSTLGESKGKRRLQMSRWVKKGKIIPLKRGLYTLPEPYRLARFSTAWLAGALYSPSYLSLEYALSWYDMIPEKVARITSVTILKTARVQNPVGDFVYRHLKRDYFFGFEELIDPYDRPYLMATREKALLDAVYFRRDWTPAIPFFTENLRLQQMESLDKKRLKVYAKKFNKKKIYEAVEVLTAWK